MKAYNDAEVYNSDHTNFKFKFQDNPGHSRTFLPFLQDKQNIQGHCQKQNIQTF